MDRLSDPHETWVFGTQVSAQASLEALLRPSHELVRVGGSRLPVAVADLTALEGALSTTQGRGLWFFFSPVGPDERTASGHLMVYTNGELFSRNMDQDPEGAVHVVSRTLDSRDLSWLPKRYQGSPLLAQYIELTEAATEAAHSLYRKRAQLALTQEHLSRSPYVYLPLTRQRHSRGENCVVFSFCPIHQNGIDDPDALQLIRQEIPFWRINEIPNRQIYFNPHLPSYRGSILVGPPETLARMSDPDHFYDGDALSFMPSEPLRKLPLAE
jgi:hypothetical protein